MAIHELSFKSGRKELVCRQLIYTIQAELGPLAAVLFTRLHWLAQVKRPCDICLATGEVYFAVRIGADFFHAFEFEAEIETVIAMLSEVKLFQEPHQPMMRVSLSAIEAVIPLPDTEITEEQITNADVESNLGKVSEGHTLEEFIRKTYQPRTNEELRRLAGRYLVAVFSE